MSRASGCRGSLALVPAAALLLSFLAAPMPALGSPKATLEDRSVPAGGTLAVAGRGFGPYEAIDVFLDERDLTVAVADEKGAFAGVRAGVPTSIEPGEHWLTLVGRRTGRSVQQRVNVATDWAQFGFDATRAGFNPFEERLGPSNAGDLQLAWSRSLISPGWLDWNATVFASPAVADGVVYIAPAGYFVDRGVNGRAYAFDARTGELLWAAPNVGTVMASPAVTQGLVLLNAAYPFRVVALDADTGRVVWTRTTIPELSFEGENFQGGSPAVYGDTVYVSVHVVVSGPHRMRPYERTYALDVGTGAIRWTRELSGDIAVSGGVIYVGGDELRALSASTGAMLWSRDMPGDSWIASPVVSGGTVYAPGGDETWRLYAFDAGDGSIRWSADLPTAAAASPAVANGVVYVLTVRGVLHAISASSGAKLWIVRTWAEPADKWDSNCAEGVCPAPSVAGGVVYVGSLGRGTYQYPGKLFAFDAASGRELLERDLPRQVMSRPAVADGMVFVGSRDGKLYAFGVPGLAPVTMPKPRAASLEPDTELLPGETHEVRTRTQSWGRVASGGLGHEASATLASTALFDDALYVGTAVDAGAKVGAAIWRGEDSRDFDRIATKGFGDAANRAVELATYDGRLWAATTNPNGFQVWVSTDGETFRQIAEAGRSSAEHATPVVFENRLLLLVDDERSGAEVRLLEQNDGAGEDFRVVVEGGLGAVSNTGFAASPSSPGAHGMVFGGALYVGTVNATGGAEIWRTADGVRWEAVASGGLRSAGNVALTPQVAFRGRLYAISRNPDGFEVYRTADGTRWQRVVKGGLGATPFRNVAGSLAVTGEPERLVLVTRNVSQLQILPGGTPIEVGITAGFQVWRSSFGAKWTEVGRPGFGDSHDYAGTLTSEGGVVYLTSDNYREGNAIWRTDDGRTWKQLFREPRPAPLSTGMALAVFDGHLLLFRGDLERGVSIWRYRPTVPVSQVVAPSVVPTQQPTAPAEGAEQAGDGLPTWAVVLIAGVAGLVLALFATWLVARSARPGHRPGLRLRHRHV